MDYLANTDDLAARQSAYKSRLRERRLAMGYSYEDLAIATGLTVMEIEDAESSEVVEAHHIARIEHVLR